jgi:chromosomal replication initiation ATPase DnaA
MKRTLKQFIKFYSANKRLFNADVNNGIEVFLASEPPSVLIADVIPEVAKIFNINTPLMFSRSRKIDPTDARYAVFYWLFENTNMSQKKVGAVFNRDHSTALHGYSQAKNRLETEQKFRSKYERVEKVFEKYYQK